VRHINDSRLVAMSIYNVAVLCLITTPVTMVIYNQQDASFAFVSLAIIFSAMITMGLVFIPKVIEVVREGNEKSDRSSAPDGGTTKEEVRNTHRIWWNLACGWWCRGTSHKRSEVASSSPNKRKESKSKSLN